MNHVLIVDQTAEDDMHEIFEHYKKTVSESKGDHFLDACESVFGKILLFPEIGYQLLPSVRKVPVTGYSYSIYYRVGRHTINIFGVIHQKRDSYHWKQRLDQSTNGAH